MAFSNYNEPFSHPSGYNIPLVPIPSYSTKNASRAFPQIRPLTTARSAGSSAEYVLIVREGGGSGKEGTGRNGGWGDWEVCIDQ